VSGVFEALVVSGLFLLIAVVAVATVVLARRSRPNSADYQQPVRGQIVPPLS